MSAEPPVLTVIAGSPTAEEIAAIVTVLLATAGPPSPPVPPTSGWSAYRRSLRTPLTPGPQAWRLSARPH